MQTIEQQIIGITQATVTRLGFEIVKLALKGSTHKVLEILIDKLNGEKVTIKDCQEISNHISILLDVENIINDKYYLEVSSAGIERPLIKFEDYLRFLGRDVTIKLNCSLNGKTRYYGKISNAENDQIYLNTSNGEVVISFVMVKKASLVLTDEMFKNLMSKKS